MSATSTLRRRAVRATLVGALALSVLTGCTTGQKDATNYKDTEDDFIAGCIELAEADAKAIAAGEDGTEGAEAITSPEDYCQCVFETISGPDGVPFEEFDKINEDLRTNGGPLPDDFVASYADCSDTNPS